VIFSGCTITSYEQQLLTSKQQRRFYFIYYIVCIIHMNIAQLLQLLFLLLTTANSQSDSSRAIKLINDSGRNLKLYWIDQSEGSHERLHLLDGTSLAEPGSQLSLSSFVGHVFEVHENPDPITGVCATDSGDQLCRVASFEVREDVLDEQSTWARTLVVLNQLFC
jgi:hypothetical protein